MLTYLAIEELRPPCNVLIVRGEQEGPFRHVVTGIDFSANSEKAARQAVLIAQQDDAYLEFVHIVPPVDSLAETLKFSAPLIPLVSEGEASSGCSQRSELQTNSLYF